MEEKEEYQDSFTIGTATNGAIKVYFNDSNAEAKIQKAKALYSRYVEMDKIRKAL